MCRTARFQNFIPHHSCAQVWTLRLLPVVIGGVVLPRVRAAQRRTHRIVIFKASTKYPSQVTVSRHTPAYLSHHPLKPYNSCKMKGTLLIGVVVYLAYTAHAAAPLPFYRRASTTGATLPVQSSSVIHGAALQSSFDSSVGMLTIFSVKPLAHTFRTVSPQYHSWRTTYACVIPMQPFVGIDFIRSFHLRGRHRIVGLVGHPRRQ